MSDFSTYIFDLYGTLIDIWTDEESPVLWEKMSEYLFENFDSKHEPKALRTRYLEVCAKEESVLKNKYNYEYPEIQIEKVWITLVNEGRKTPLNLNVNDACIQDLCVFFRETSRLKLCVYDGVLETLKKLKEMNKNVFLLSNAQWSFTKKELADAGISQYFEDLYISSEREIKKPQKEFLELLLTEHKLEPSECVMVGNDILSDVGVAFKNNVKSIFLNTYNYSPERIEKELFELGMDKSKYMPQIIDDGDITKILL